MNDFISLADASERLGMHVATLRAWVRSGRIPSYRFGQRFTRVRWSELVEVLKSEVPPGSKMASYQEGEA